MNTTEQTEYLVSDTGTVEFDEVSDSKPTDYERERGKPMPSKNHSRLQAILNALFYIRYGKKFTTYSELSLELLGDRLTPDICLYPYVPSNWLHDQHPVIEPPLLAIEIVSPSQSVTEILLKARRYFAGGVQSFWLVEPALQTISVLYPDDTLQTFAAGMVQDKMIDIELPIAEVFEA
jgi:Uma2 family endonuclease